jgi:hypothetical protein
LVKAVMMAFFERGVPSPRSSRTAGAVRATMALISAEPESDEVKLTSEVLQNGFACCDAGHVWL